jgi:hypothetical protein
MDDDIQFLGIVSPISSTKPSYPHPTNPSMSPPVSGASLAVHADDTNSPVLTFPLIGIMLVIPKSGDEPTQTLRFIKSRSAVVHIGRASSSIIPDPDKSPDTIQFRCPVISRRHARLMFSSGHVCARILVTCAVPYMTHIRTCTGVHRGPPFPSWHPPP